MLKTYFPILVFAFLGLTVGGVFAMLNHLIGPKKPARATSASRRQTEPYESGIPVEPMKNFRFGVSFYLLAMLFNIVAPTGLGSPRGALFNFDWITLVVMVVLLVIGGIYFVSARPDRRAPKVQDLEEPAEPAKVK